MNPLSRYKKMLSNNRNLTVISFSLLFGYVLSFVFGGEVLGRVLHFFYIEAIPFAFSALIAHLAGLLLAGVLFTPYYGVKKTMLGSVFLAAAATFPFFFLLPVYVYLGSLLVSAFSSGVYIASWGCYLKICTRRNERYKTCADVLIGSNLIMILLNGMSAYIHPMTGLWLCLFIILSAGWFTKLFPDVELQTAELSSPAPRIPLKKTVFVLAIFVVMLTITSGLMYSVFNPAFQRIKWLTGWYWAVPYVVVLILMRRLLQTRNRPYSLYMGMGMIILSFVLFMLTSHNASSYLLVDTLMLGACGIFDLFWLSIFGEILEYTRRTVLTAGICMSSNVLGVLIGSVLGHAISSGGMPDSYVAVLALVIVCITTAILPFLNMLLVQLLQDNVYLYAYFTMAPEKRAVLTGGIPALAPLSAREKEVLALLLEAHTNKAIAGALHISEHTVKTHVKNIFGKYGVASRAELIASVLKSRSGPHP